MVRRAIFNDNYMLHVLCVVFVCDCIACVVCVEYV